MSFPVFILLMLVLHARRGNINWLISPTIIIGFVLMWVLCIVLYVLMRAAGQRKPFSFALHEQPTENVEAAHMTEREQITLLLSQIPCTYVWQIKKQRQLRTRARREAQLREAEWQHLTEQGRRKWKEDGRQ